MSAMTSPSVETLVPDLSGQMNNVLKEQRLPGLAVGIVRDQELAWFGGSAGPICRPVGAPDRQTLFRVASITKTFTAAAILQLRDEGRLSLDDPLQRHIPEFAKAQVRAGTLEKVTLRRLLTHHSGLTTEAPLPCWDALEFPTREALLAAMPGIEIVIPPDSAFKYSNLAFGLLGEVVARVSGRSYAEYLQTQILDPLGMSGALELNGDLKSRLAIGYYPRPFDDDFDVAPYVSLQGLSACGQLHASVADLARLGRAAVSHAGCAARRQSDPCRNDNRRSRIARSTSSPIGRSGIVSAGGRPASATVSTTVTAGAFTASRPMFSFPSPTGSA